MDQATQTEPNQQQEQPQVGQRAGNTQHMPPLERVHAAQHVDPEVDARRLRNLEIYLAGLAQAYEGLRVTVNVEYASDAEDEREDGSDEEEEWSEDEYTYDDYGPWDSEDDDEYEPDLYPGASQASVSRSSSQSLSELGSEYTEGSQAPPSLAALRERHRAEAVAEVAAELWLQEHRGRRRARVNAPPPLIPTPESPDASQEMASLRQRYVAQAEAEVEAEGRSRGDQRPRYRQAEAPEGIQASTSASASSSLSYQRLRQRYMLFAGARSMLEQREQAAEEEDEEEDEEEEEEDTIDVVYLDGFALDRGNLDHERLWRRAPTGYSFRESIWTMRRRDWDAETDDGSQG